MAVMPVDVVVVGGGMVGATAALAMARHDLRIAVVEAFDAQEPGTDSMAALRVSAINAASSRLFSRLGVWQAMEARRVTPYQSMQVWDAGSSGSVRFSASDLYRPELGHIVENWVVQHALADAVKSHPGIQWLSPVSPVSIEAGLSGVDIELSDGRRVQAKLAVAADGARSKMRELAGIEVNRREYGQHALVTVVDTEHSHEFTAWQRFLPDGPLAFLPLWNGQSSIVWSMLPDDAARLCELSEAEFCRELGVAFDHRLGAITACFERAVFPLGRQDAQTYVGERLALVGDAAHVVHPLAGQGVNLGLMDAAALSEVVSDAQQKNRDIGASMHLRRYQRWRRGQNRLMATAMDAFDRLFREDMVAVRLGRGLGFDIAQNFGPLKSVLARHAMGDGFDLPRLARSL